jgi:flagellar basal body-associated protein FliL
MGEKTPPQEGALLTTSTSGEDSAPEKKKRTGSVLLIIGLIILGGTLAIFVGMFFLPRDWLSRLRDISIILLVVLALISVLLVLFLLALLITAINRASKGIEDLLERGGAAMDQVKHTATSLKGTADFVGQRVASPFIRVSSWAAGIGETLVTLFRGKKNKEGHDERA